MNNTDAIWYLLKTKFMARLRSLLKKPIVLLITIALLGLMAYNIFSYLTSDIGLTNSFLMNSAIFNLIGGLVIFITMIVFVVNKTSALVFENDAIFLFTSPFSNKQTYTYLIFLTLQQSLVFGVGYVFYMLIFFFQIIDGPAHMLGIVISVFLHFLLVTMYFNYEYIRNAVYKDVRSISKIPIIIISVIIVVLFVNALNFEFTFSSIQESIFHPLFKYMPFIGTFGWIANAFRIGDVSALIPIGIILLIIFVFTTRMFKIEGNFVEKALQDAEYASAIRRKAESGRTVETIDSTKVESRKVKGSFLTGAWALFSKHVLVIRKTRRYLPFGMLMFGAGYSVLAIFLQEIETFKILVIFSLMFGNDASTFLMDELEKPFIYLIPDSELKKISSTLLIPLLRVMCLLLLYFVILVFLGESIIDSIIYLLFVNSTYMIITAVDVLVIKFLKSNSNVIIKVYLNIILYVIALLPTIVLMVLMFVVMDITNFNLLFVGGMIFNIIISLTIIYSSKSILKGNNLAA